MINHYANPAFNAKDEALSFFTKETRDQYRGFSRQLEQMKVIHLLGTRDCVVRYGVVTRTYKVLENLKVGCILPMFWCRTLP